MGKALYRKYRSKSLDEVVGQEHITSTLKNALKKGAISHAYLFTGPRGVGKTSVARILAYEINGLPYDEEATHLDIIEIDAASNRRIDEIRDLREKVHIAPTSAKYKVYIIDEVHMLTREAFNALLKTLEEPPEHVVFILATTEAHKVPETIISRTQRFSFRPIGQEQAIAHLKQIAKKEKLPIDDGALTLLAQHGKGSFRDSISMLDQIAGFGADQITATDVESLLGVPNQDLLMSLLSSIASGNVDKLFETTTLLREQGANPATTAQELISILRKQVIEQSGIITPYDAVDLMKSLLSLTGSNSSFVAIEVGLLDAIKFSPQNSIELKELRPLEPKNLKSENNKIVEEENIQPTAVERSEVEAPELIETQDDEVVEPEKELVNISNGNWEDVLNSLKVQHNTLYGVLRMAKIIEKKDSVILEFRFAFHKKQLDHPKNMTILRQFVTDHLGKAYKIESVVAESKDDEKSQKITKSDPETLISSVSNIFGGAELLES